jgi:hypothetical protein
VELAEPRLKEAEMKKKPGPPKGRKRGPRLETVLKQVRAMNLKTGESVVLYGLRFTKTKEGFET